MKLRTCFFIAIFFFAQSISAVTFAADWLILKNASLFDGRSHSALINQTLTIRDNLIVANDQQPAPEDTVREIDLSGKFIIPGLIDGHVHISNIGENRAAFFNRLLKGGVTSVRDMSGDARLLAILKRDIAAGTLTGPTIHYSATFGGPTFFTDPRVIASSVGYISGEAPWALAVTDESDLSLLVAEAKGSGATGIKIYADLPPALTAALIKEALHQNMRVWTHATIFPTRPSEIVEAGGEVLSHITYAIWEAAETVPDSYLMRKNGPFDSVTPDDPKIIRLFERMADRGAMFDATLYIAFKLFSEESQNWTFEAAAIAHKNGVTFVAGTDDVMDEEENSLPNIHNELALFVEKIDMSPAEAIEAATYNAARAMGIEDERGTIAVGKMADLMILNANPLVNIQATRDIHLVIKEGKIIE